MLPTPSPPPSGAGVLPGVREAYPHSWFVGEVIQGDYAAYVEASGLDSVTQYELWKGIWSSLIDGNLFELAWALRRHNQWLERFTPMTFVGNHDVTRLATRLRDRRLIGAALAVLLTVGGTPSIYYGDEQAFEGVKEERAGGDDAIRPAFPLGDAGLAPYGSDVFRLHQDLIGLAPAPPVAASGPCRDCRPGQPAADLRLDRNGRLSEPARPPGSRHRPGLEDHNPRTGFVGKSLTPTDNHPYGHGRRHATVRMADHLAERGSTSCSSARVAL